MIDNLCKSVVRLCLGGFISVKVAKIEVRAENAFFYHIFEV